MLLKFTVIQKAFLTFAPRKGLASSPPKFKALRKDGVILDMKETSVNKIEAQTSKKVKGAKVSKTPAIWVTLNRARRKFYQQLKATQNNATKIACIDEVAMEVYQSKHEMVWYDLLTESKRLTNLIDFNEYCHSLQRNPAFVAQHVAFEGSGTVNKVMRYGVESVLGNRILAYDEPLFKTVKVRALLAEAKPAKTIKEMVEAVPASAEKPVAPIATAEAPVVKDLNMAENRTDAEAETAA